MKNSKKAIDFAKENNGFITLKEAKTLGISNGTIFYLTENSVFEKSDIGVYVLKDTFDDPYFNLQNRCQKGIFSGVSALFLQGLTDINPTKIVLTFPKGYNYMHVIREDVECHVVDKDKYDIGIIKVKSEMNNELRCYCAERTLCEILKPRNKIDIRIITDAFKIYVKSGKHDFNKIMEYAKLFKVEEKVRSYLEVLL